MFGGRRRWIYISEILIGVGFLIFLILSSLTKTWDTDLREAVEMRDEGLKSQAEKLFISALKKAEKKSSDLFPLEVTLYGLAQFYYNEGRYIEAELLFKRLIVVQKKLFSQDHPEKIATTFKTLSYLYIKKGNYTEAKKMEARAKAIMTKPKLKAPNKHSNP